ncbi:uncharacterized protein LOC111386878 [Olea europaea var. sylvestris]|uniref:uncharacterized protein LOC111378750 n=1 Tax=Olea europaea var. sylvestris TaxID=158386 RepID=UPI000C1CE980|nr:uncharacterized protein LOC111378750 [Olea europaea var. sylvestris]XP_022867134.1 uncharacterized protein LOC111386878 [Olea europaea var. sylvestris]
MKTHTLTIFPTPIPPFQWKPTKHTATTHHQPKPPNQQHQPIFEEEQRSSSSTIVELILVAPSTDGLDGTIRPPIKRNLEEMAKRPSWLSNGWMIDLRVRSSRATAGTIDWIVKEVVED